MAHNVKDSLEPVELSFAYLETLKAAGTEAWLVRVYSALPGHCNFTNEQVLTLIKAMEQWLDTGRQPDPAQFPISLGLTHRAAFGQ